MAQHRPVKGTVMRLFAPDIFERFALVGIPPEAIAAHMDEAEQRERLQKFMSSFVQFAGNAII